MEPICISRGIISGFLWGFMNIRGVWHSYAPLSQWLPIGLASEPRPDRVDRRGRVGQHKMTIRHGRWLAPLLALFLAVPESSQGATIEVSPIDSSEVAVVSVTGPFEAADIEQFRTKTSTLSKAIVVFATDGGSLTAGIEIGTMI